MTSTQYVCVSKEETPGKHSQRCLASNEFSVKVCATIGLTDHVLEVT